MAGEKEDYVIDSMSYDAAGNLVRLSGWQKLGGVWQNVYYIDYTYNAAGLITSRSNYNNFGGSWELGGIYWQYNGKSTYQYDNRGNCTEYHQYDHTDYEVERSVYTYDYGKPLSSTVIPWNPEMDRPRMYDNADACVREAWHSVDVDHVLQYVCDYVYDYSDVVTGVECPAVSEVSLYPNPATDRVVLDGLSDGEAEVRIHDLSGRLVLTRLAAGPTALLDISSLAPGCYVVRVVQGDEVKVVKVVVER